MRNVQRGTTMAGELSRFEFIALQWWHNVAKRRITKTEFVKNRNEWETLQTHVHNIMGELPGHDDAKDVIIDLDKAGLLGASTVEEALEIDKARRNNRSEFGKSEGAEGFTCRVADMAGVVRRDLSPLYKQYITGQVWRTRSRRYLDECCTDKGMWVCEMCGTPHSIADYGRTIQVHHNDYSELNGKEPDTALLGVCDGLCHDAADLVRKIKAGKIDAALLNDSLRTLFGEL